MPDEELILEKYTVAPIKIKVNNEGMLECNGVVIDDNVITFDAVTDKSGAVHGVFFKSDGHIVYFRLADKLPVSKTIATGVAKAALCSLSVTEHNGTPHILIVKKEKDEVLYHYRMQNGSWVRSVPKLLGPSEVYTDCCPCSDGRFAVITATNEKMILYLEADRRWQTLKSTDILKGNNDLSLAFEDGNIEIITENDENGISSDVLFTFSAEKDKATSFTETTVSQEDNMANGNMISSKYISELKQNSDDIAELKREISALKESFTGIRRSLESSEQQYKFSVTCRETLRQHEMMINQLSVKTQEMTNRINGMAKKN